MGFCGLVYVEGGLLNVAISTLTLDLSLDCPAAGAGECGYILGRHVQNLRRSPLVATVRPCRCGHTCSHVWQWRVCACACVHVHAREFALTSGCAGDSVWDPRPLRRGVKVGEFSVCISCT